MEEVDKIIIDSLKNLDCDIDEDVTTLKSFTPDIVVSAISTCLEIIQPQLKLPRKLPSSMSARIKFTSSLAQQIKEFGFKGDMGYQTILYCNEVEVRRVLMFLLEHLPKESSAITPLAPTGYVPRIVKQIEDSLRLSLSQMWLPTEILNLGTRETNQGVIVNSFGNSCPMDSVNLIVPDESTDPLDAPYIPFISNQCSPRQLIPSVLSEGEGTFTHIKNCREMLSQTTLTEDISKEILANISASELSEKMGDIQKASASDSENIGVIEENKVEVLLNSLREKKEALLGLQEVVNRSEDNLVKLKAQRDKEQDILVNSLAKVKVKNKTLAVVNNEENKVKLRNLIQKAENRLADMAKQWEEVQQPLLEEHKSLKSSVSSGSKQQDDLHKLKNLKKTYKEMVTDFKQKCALEANLIERCKELNNKNNRAAYTKRILEIVANIQKQNKEIQKILADTRQVQKDINNLTGQVDRSFTLSDELIFHDCKTDESARKAYKMLAALREECNAILQGVTDIGQAERELRNLEEQVESEKNKDFRDKLDKVQRDLVEIRKEVQLLKK